MRDDETPKSPAATPADAEDDAPRVSSLRPATSGCSLRRLLNVASLAVAGVLLVALAVHWLPGVLSARPTAQPTHSSRQTTNVPATPARGSGWKPIGPNWAQDITFSTGGSLGYTCGALGPGAAPILVTVYDPQKETWGTPENPATGSSCQVSVSPVDAADVVLVANRCTVPYCTNSFPISQVYRSHNRGATWSQLRLPGSLLVTRVAWSNIATLFLVTAFIPSGNITSPLAYSLFVSRAGGPLKEITPQQLTGHSAPMGVIQLYTSGSLIYASVDGRNCPSFCTRLVRTNDEGYHWTQLAEHDYQDGYIILGAAQIANNMLAGTAFVLSSQTLSVLRSDDNGTSWRALPALPTNPQTGGATLFVLPDYTVVAFCYGPANAVYALRDSTTAWQTIAPLPVGTPLAVQYDANGHAVALWGEAHSRNESDPTRGLEYYPLTGNAS